MNTPSLQQKVEDQILDSYEAMYRLAYTYVRNEEDALDIVQESVYKAIKNCVQGTAGELHPHLALAHCDEYSRGLHPQPEK